MSNSRLPTNGPKATAPGRLCCVVCAMGAVPEAERWARKLMSTRIFKWLEGGKVKEVVEWALQGYGRGGKGSLDEGKSCIRDGGVFG